MATETRQQADSCVYVRGQGARQKMRATSEYKRVEPNWNKTSSNTEEISANINIRYTHTRLDPFSCSIECFAVVRCTSVSPCTNYSLSDSPKLSTRSKAFIVALSLMSKCLPDYELGICVANLPSYPQDSKLSPPLCKNRFHVKSPVRSCQSLISPLLQIYTHMSPLEIRVNNGLQFVVVNRKVRGEMEIW